MFCFVLFCFWWFFFVFGFVLFCFGFVFGFDFVLFCFVCSTCPCLTKAICLTWEHLCLIFCTPILFVFEKEGEEERDIKDKKEKKEKK